MKNRVHKDKVKYRNKLRKRQQNESITNRNIQEDDCGISDETMARMSIKMNEMSGGIGHEVIRDRSLEKMSDILMEYGRPIMETIITDNKAEYENAIKIVIVFWNSAIMEEEIKGRKEIEKMLKPIMPDAEAKSVVKYMLTRKHEMYPDNKRMILNYELNKTPDGFHLSVVSTIPEEKQQEKSTTN